MGDRLETFKAIFRPWYIKLGTTIAGFLAFVTGYAACADQFPILPKLQDVGVKTFLLLPWWGWLLVLQAFLVYALFEYVRVRIPGTALRIEGPQTESLAAQINGVRWMALQPFQFAYWTDVQSRLLMQKELAEKAVTCLKSAYQNYNDDFNHIVRDAPHDLVEARREIQHIANTELKLNCDLTLSPSFTENQARSELGDSSIRNEALRGEYRRLSSNWRYMNAEIEKMIKLTDQKRRQALQNMVSNGA